MNTVQLTGRLTRDPELVQLDSGSVCRMRLAIENMGRNETGYVDVSTFGKAGEAAARVLSKGWLVAVDGRLDYRHWVADDGANRSAIGVIGNVEFLAAPRAAAATVGAGRGVTAQPRARRWAGPPATDLSEATMSPEHLLRTPLPHSPPSAKRGSRRSGA